MAKFILYLFISCLGIGLAAQETDSPKALKKIKISLIWSFQSEFAGPIMAKELGFFADAGYDVELISAVTNPYPAEELKKGKTDYSITWFAIAVKANSYPDTKIKLVSQIVRGSNTTVMAWREFKGKKIEKLQDLDGEKITQLRPPLSVSYQLLFQKQNIKPIPITQYATPKLFYKKGIAACTVLKYQGYELFRLLRGGDDEIILFDLTDYGINLPEDGLYTLASNHDEKEQHAIADAIQKGWLHAKNNPRETANTVVKYALMGNAKYSNETLMFNNLHSILPSIFLDSEPINNYGKLDRETYERYTKELLKNNENHEILPYEEFVTPKARIDG